MAMLSSLHPQGALPRQALAREIPEGRVRRPGGWAFEPQQASFSYTYAYIYIAIDKDNDGYTYT